MARADRALESAEVAAWSDFYSAAPRDVAHTLGLAQQRVHGGLLLINRRVPSIVFNRAFGVELDASDPTEDADATVDTITRHFHDAGIEEWVLQTGPEDRALHQALTVRGFTPHVRSWAKFVRRDTAPLPTGVMDTTLTIREVTVAEALALGAVVTEVFRFPADAIAWISALVGRQGWQIFAAFDGDRAVASGRGISRWCVGVAGLWRDASCVSWTRCATRVACCANPCGDACGGNIDHDRSGYPLGWRDGIVLQQHWACGVRGRV